MKIDAKVWNANVDEPETLEIIGVDEDYVEADVDEIRAYIIDELEAKRPAAKINYNFEVQNLQDIIEDIAKRDFDDKTNTDHPA